MFTVVTSYQNTLCVSLRQNKYVELISSLKKNIYKADFLNLT